MNRLNRPLSTDGKICKMPYSRTYKRKQQLEEELLYKQIRKDNIINILKVITFLSGIFLYIIAIFWLMTFIPKFVNMVIGI